MTKDNKESQINSLINEAKNIVIVQADNPDGDSLASALALEEILHELKKEPYLYSGIDMPSYLRYIPGWDRVSKDLPNNFDLSIIVDCSTVTLFESLNKSNQYRKLSSKPCITIDHHLVDEPIGFASVNYYQKAVSTGEILYELAKKLNWPLNLAAKERITTSILSDSLGLMTENTSARSIHIIAELVDGGVKLPALEEARRDVMRKSPELLGYKGELLKRVEFHDDNKIAMVTIPWQEIEKYSPLYNPSMLVIDDMRLVEGTDIAIAFKVYKDGKITAKIRSNYGSDIARDLAVHFNGGGHPYASGFKIEAKENRSFDEVKNETIKVTSELLATASKK
jgi:phosphoesterase RecJ-like protein